MSVELFVALKLQLPYTMSDKVIDKVESRTAIYTTLVKIERIAKTWGSVVALAHPYPMTVRRLQQCIGGIDKRGLVFMPIAAVVAKQKIL